MGASSGGVSAVVSIIGGLYAMTIDAGPVLEGPGSGSSIVLESPASDLSASGWNVTGPLFGFGDEGADEKGDFTPFPHCKAVSDQCKEGEPRVSPPRAFLTCVMKDRTVPSSASVAKYSSYPNLPLARGILLLWWLVQPRASKVSARERPRRSAFDCLLSREIPHNTDLTQDAASGVRRLLLWCVVTAGND